MTYVLSKESRSAVAGTFSFYPVDGGQDFPAGSHHVRFRIEGDELTGGYGRWIQQPERRQKQKSANGRILSDTRLELQFEGSTCPPFSVEKFLGPAENAPRVVEKQQPKPKPVPAELTGEQKAASASPFVGRWEGPGTCMNGPHKIVLNVFPTTLDGRFNATLTIIPKAMVQASDLSVKGILVNDRDFRYSVRFEPVEAIGAVTNRMGIKQLPWFKGNMEPRGELRGVIEEVGCHIVSMKKLSDSPTLPGSPTPKLSISEELKGFEAQWDGAIIDRQGRAYPVAFDIRKSTEGSESRLFDVAVKLDGRDGKIALSMSQSGKLSIVNILNESSFPVALRGSVTSKLLTADGQSYFTIATQGDADGTGILFRRKPEQSGKPLQDLCKEEIERFATDRNRARETARELRIKFFPALAGYSETQASLWDALAERDNRGSPISRSAFPGLARDCMLTTAYFGSYMDKGLFSDIVDMQAVAALRIKVARSNFGKDWSPPAIRVTPLADPKQVEASEAALAPLAQAWAQMQSAGEILAVIKGNAAAFENARPSVVVSLLQPVAKRLDDIAAGVAASAAADRKARALARLSSITLPREMLGAWADSVEQLLRGEKSRFSGSEIGFFGGFAAGAIKECGLPATIPERLQLSGFVTQGMDRVIFGENYATGGIPETLAGTFKGSIAFGTGEAVPKNAGCTNAFVTAVLSALSEAATLRTQAKDGGASLFIRSCSLDRNQSQCECMAREMQAAIPNINDQKYDRSQLVSTIQRNPATAMKLATICQVGKY